VGKLPDSEVILEYSLSLLIVLRDLCGVQTEKNRKYIIAFFLPHGRKESLNLGGGTNLRK